MRPGLRTNRTDLRRYVAIGLGFVFVVIGLLGLAYVVIEGDFGALASSLTTLAMGLSFMWVGTAIHRLERRVLRLERDALRDARAAAESVRG